MSSSQIDTSSYNQSNGQQSMSNGLNLLRQSTDDLRQMARMKQYGQGHNMSQLGEGQEYGTTDGASN